MKKKANSSHKLFNLDNDVIKRIKEISNMQKLTQSQLIEQLVNQWDEQVNPLHKAKSIRDQKKLLKQRIDDLDREEEIMMKNAVKIEEWRKVKQKARPLIINNLARIILEKRYSDAEIIAKNQAIKLGIPSITLIEEALNKIKTGI